MLTFMFLAVAGTLPVGAQSRTYDAATGEYVIRYYSAEFARDTVVRIDPPNRIAPALLLDSVADLDAGVRRYHYTLSNGSTASTTQPVVSIELPCDPLAEPLAPASWYHWTGGSSAPLEGVPYCAFLGSNGVGPGAREPGFSVTSSALLDLVTVMSLGPRPVVIWPDADEHEQSVHDLVHEVIGVTGGWVTSAAVSPILAPEEITIDLLQSQLAAVCTDPLWIDDPALCAALSASLDEAEAYLASGNIAAARYAISEAADVVDLRREPLGAIENDAAWLLRLNLEQLLENLGRGVGQVSLLAPADMRVVSVADSAGYFVYSYELSNPASSSAAIGEFSVSVHATSGTPAPNPATGDFLNLANMTNAMGPEAPRAPVGPISPPSWTAVLERSAVLSWLPPSNGPASTDSVAAGATRAGFGIRSSYLPGIGTARVRPTWQACCSTWDPGTGEHPRTVDFEVESTTIAPRYEPVEITVSLVQNQIRTACTDPLWIADISLCATLSDSLDSAESRLSSGDVAGARNAISAAIEIVGANQEPVGAIESNAAWLLRLNLQQLLANLEVGLSGRTSSG